MATAHVEELILQAALRTRPCSFSLPICKAIAAAHELLLICMLRCRTQLPSSNRPRARRWQLRRCAAQGLRAWG